MPSQSGRAKGLTVVVVVGAVVVVDGIDVVVDTRVDVVASAAAEVVTRESEVGVEHAETATSTSSQVRHRMGATISPALC
jgi:hypothetical protein